MSDETQVLLEAINKLQQDIDQMKSAGPGGTARQAGDIEALADQTAPEVKDRLRWCAKLWWLCARTDRHKDVPGFWSEEWGDGQTSTAVEILRKYNEKVSSRAVNELLFFWKNDLAAKIEYFDTQPWLLGVGNGVVDLRTGEREDAAPSLMLTRKTETRYNKKAKCPTFMHHLERLFQGCDPQSAKWLQKAIGASLVGSVQESGQFYVHLYGDPGNGKGTLFHAIGKALGEEILVTINADSLTGREGHPTWLMNLRGARIAITEDIGAVKPGLMKTLTGGDKITARYAHKDTVTWEPTHNFFTTANEPIQTTTVRGVPRLVTALSEAKHWASAYSRGETARVGGTTC